MHKKKFLKEKSLNKNFGVGELSDKELSEVVGGDTAVRLNSGTWTSYYNILGNIKTLVCPKCGQTYTYPKGQLLKMTSLYEFCRCKNPNCNGEALDAIVLYDDNSGGK